MAAAPPAPPRPNRKPSLALTTPVTSCFPADALKSASSVRSPLSAQLWKPTDAAQASAGLPSAGLPSAGLLSAGIYSPIVANLKVEDPSIKTPITPPVAYMDFLKLASPAFPASPGATGMSSPPLTGKRLARTSTTSSLASNSSAASSGAEDSDTAPEMVEKEIESAPTTSSSEVTDCSCDCDGEAELVHKSPKASTAGIIPPSPFAAIPMSAPATGATSFPSMKVPASPAVSNVDSPVMSPFSARSVRSPFDWEAALKARKAAGAPTPRSAVAKSAVAAPAPSTGHSCGKGKTAVRHIREVVTRTVTYTPRMEPAPKGKRRKVE